MGPVRDLGGGSLRRHTTIHISALFQACGEYKRREGRAARKPARRVGRCPEQGWESAQADFLAVGPKPPLDWLKPYVNGIVRR